MHFSFQGKFSSQCLGEYSMAYFDQSKKALENKFGLDN